MAAAVQEYVIDPEKYAKIDLKSGGHQTRELGMCLMEAAAFLAGEQHTDHPQCVSQALGTFGRGLNDAITSDLRQDLKALIPAMLGTRLDGFDPVRSFMAFDWLIHTWLTKWVSLAADKSPKLRLRLMQLNTLGPVSNRNCLRKVVDAVNTTHEDMRGFAAATGNLHPTGLISSIVQRSGYGPALNTALHAVYMSMGMSRRDPSKVFDTIGEIAVYAAAISGERVQPVAEELLLSAIDLFTEMVKAPVLPA